MTKLICQDACACCGAPWLSGSSQTLWPLTRRAVERFLREARAASALNHPGVSPDRHLAVHQHPDQLPKRAALHRAHHGGRMREVRIVARCRRGERYERGRRRCSAAARRERQRDRATRRPLPHRRTQQPLRSALAGNGSGPPEAAWDVGVARHYPVAVTHHRDLASVGWRNRPRSAADQDVWPRCVVIAARKCW